MGNNITTTRYTKFNNLAEMLTSRALEEPDRIAFTYIDYMPSDEIVKFQITYKELYKDAMRIAAYFESKKAVGERALLLYTPGMEYIKAFFGCIFAGVVAVPVYVPISQRQFGRLEAIIASSRAKYLLTSTDTYNILSNYFNMSHVNVEWIFSNSIEVSFSDNFGEININSESNAFIQYTSGSTSSPKGVVLNNGNLIHNLSLISKAMNCSKNSVGVIWLPPYHDMGLIGGILGTIYSGFSTVLMSPISFLQKPIRWLQIISEYKGTISGGPNFSFELCIKKIDDEQISKLDLYSWEVCFNGAEPIRYETLKNFIQKFNNAGFSKNAFYPCYGLAESTLICSGGKFNEPFKYKTFNKEMFQKNIIVEDSIENEDCITVVSSGGLLEKNSIIIVNPETLGICPEKIIGEVCIHSKSVADSYWEMLDQTNKYLKAEIPSIGDKTFLRTGDLGFFDDDELYIAGRIKDLIIIRGKNHYPQDIEKTVEESNNLLRKGCNAAFSIMIDGEEKIVVIQELKNHISDFEMSKIKNDITKKISENHEVSCHEIVFINTGTIPKTSSGKIQRSACKMMYLNNELIRIDYKLSVNKQNSFKNDNSIKKEHITPVDNNIESWLKEWISKKLQIPFNEIDCEKVITEYGLDSLLVVELAYEINEQYNIDLNTFDFANNLTIRVLSNKLNDKIIRSLELNNDSKNIISIKKATTNNDFISVWKLRYSVYLEAGHIAPNDKEMLSDHRDEKSITFIASACSDIEKIVGTIRITKDGDCDFESEKYIAPYRIPGEKAAEITRLAVLNDYQKRVGFSSIFLYLLREVYLYSVNSNVDVLYIITIDLNAKVYEKIGFQRVSGPFKYENYFRDHYVLKLYIDRINSFWKTIISKLII